MRFKSRTSKSDRKAMRDFLTGGAAKDFSDQSVALLLTLGVKPSSFMYVMNQALKDGDFYVCYSNLTNEI